MRVAGSTGRVVFVTPCPPLPDSYVKALIPSRMVFGCGTFGW